MRGQEAANAATIEIVVQRRAAEPGAEPHDARYRVPLDADTSVLDGLCHIKDHLDGSLAFRWSCRMAICGSCGMTVNGEPRLACKTFLRDYAPGPVTVGPLDHFPVVRDLVIDQDDVVSGMRDAKLWLIRSEPRALEEGAHAQTPKQLARIRAPSSCINCMLCYAACPQYGLDRGFTGPALLALVDRYNADSRDQGKDERMPVINAEDGVWGCTLVGTCSAVCPKDVDPAAAVNRNKVESAKDYFLRFLKPGKGSGA